MKTFCVSWVRRTLSPCTKAVKAQAYSTLVRPQLEYASEIWNPNTTAVINRLEQVQRSSAKFVFADYSKRNHVTPLIQELNWDSLHTRRLIQQATMLYRIQYALVSITFPPCFQRASHISLRTDHPLKGCRMGRSDKVSLWYVSLLINTRFRFFILE